MHIFFHISKFFDAFIFVLIAFSFKFPEDYVFLPPSSSLEDFIRSRMWPRGANTYVNIHYGIQKFIHDLGRPTPRLPFPLPISSGKLHFLSSKKKRCLKITWTKAFQDVYCLSKKSWPILFSNWLQNYFLDRQYMHSDIHNFSFTG